jgi:hypothetical protein
VQADAMAEISAATARKLAPLVRLLSSSSDGEVLGAARAIMRTLKTAGADIHTLADHVEHANGKKILEQDMRHIFTAGYEKGVHDTEERLHGFDDFRSLDGLPSWHTMARYCQQRGDQLSDREEEFVNQMASQTVWREPSEKQAKWLKSIFLKLGGRI